MLILNVDECISVVRLSAKESQYKFQFPLKVSCFIEVILFPDVYKRRSLLLFLNVDRLISVTRLFAKESHHKFQFPLNVSGFIEVIRFPDISK
jgi:hypothetical protein